MKDDFEYHLNVPGINIDKSKHPTITIPKTHFFVLLPFLIGTFVTDDELIERLKSSDDILILVSSKLIFLFLKK